MSAIVNIYQIVTYAPSSPSNMVLFEVQTNDSPKKRMIVARKAALDPNAYFMNHEALQELGIFTEGSLAQYEDVWPTDVTPVLNTDGTLPLSFNSNFANADFGVGKVGTYTHNGYNYVLGSFTTTPTTTTATTASVPVSVQLGASTQVETTEVQWYDRPKVKTWGFISLGLGLLTLIVRSFRKS